MLTEIDAVLAFDKYCRDIGCLRISVIEQKFYTSTWEAKVVMHYLNAPKYPGKPYNIIVLGVTDEFLRDSEL